MKKPTNSKHAAVFILSLGLAMTVQASDLYLTVGGGSDRYETYSMSANLDLPRLPLTLDLDYTHIRSDRAEVLTQEGAGLSWKVSDWLRANYRRTVIHDQTYRVDGHEYGASVYLNAWWDSRLYTRLDLGLGDYDYDPRVSPAVAQLIAGRVPRQRRYSIALTQNITEDFYAYASYDEYRYTRDPAFLASLLIRRFMQPTTAASTLVSFPKVGRSLGFGWYLDERWLLDASYSDTDNVVAQAQDVKKLKLNYQWSKSLSLNAAFTRSDSAGVIGLAGNQVSAPSATNIVEFGLGYNF